MSQERPPIAVPGLLGLIPAPGPAFYIRLQRDHAPVVKPPCFDSNTSCGPVSPWFPMPVDAPATEVLDLLERHSLLDVSYDQKHVRLRWPHAWVGIAWLSVADAEEINEVDALAVATGSIGRKVAAPPRLPEKRVGQAGYAYVMATNVDEGPYKVGKTRDLKQRHRSLQAMNGEPLSILRTWHHDSDYSTAERALHDALFLHRSHGEWFACGLEAIDVAARGIDGLVPA